MSIKFYLCIHGHFYQPPRENPWTGKIENEPSAAPFNNWNERILFECYKPNTEAEILDLERNIVLEKINNFRYLSFNFGPTLLQWIKKTDFETFSKIIDADRWSVENHNGFGNAIAQVYNHIIMPLATREDKITQIRWGKRDFEYHYGRQSLGLWLPETACDTATIQALIDEKVGFIILDPSQVESIRKFGDSEWIDVSNGSVDTTNAYRIFDNTEERYIDVFFYNSYLSKNIAFGDLAFDAGRFLNAIMSVVKNGIWEQLVSIVADGETFGHHKRFTERTLAYVFGYLAKEKGISIVNFAEYLSLHPPQYEARLKLGKDGLGTSWSCSHGVGRWKEDCGCSTGSQSGWNQKWRAPLRTALNHLKAKLDTIFITEGSKFFKDVWAARNNYIDLILDPSDSNISAFFNEHSAKRLTNEEVLKAIDLLEMEKFSMFMFTSCGWFFSDISGIETIKILEYAVRAIEFAEKISGESLFKEFANMLEVAKSNIPERGNGKNIVEAIRKREYEF